MAALRFDSRPVRDQRHGFISTSVPPTSSHPTPRKWLQHPQGEDEGTGCPLTPPLRPPSSARPALLPELDDRGGEVGGAVGDPEALVLPQGVLQAVGCVPAVVAFGPGELRLEGLEQIVHGPGEDDDVVYVQEGHNHDGGIADACERGQARRESEGGQTRHSHTLNQKPWDLQAWGQKGPSRRDQQVSVGGTRDCMDGQVK